MLITSLEYKQQFLHLQLQFHLLVLIVNCLWKNAKNYLNNFIIIIINLQKEKPLFPKISL